MKKSLFVLLIIVLSAIGTHADVTRTVVFIPEGYNYTGSLPTCVISSTEKVELAETEFVKLLDVGSLKTFFKYNYLAGATGIVYTIEMSDEKDYINSVVLHVFDNYKIGSVVCSPYGEDKIEYNEEAQLITIIPEESRDAFEVSFKFSGIAVNTKDDETKKAMKIDYIEVTYTLVGVNDPVCENPVIAPEASSIEPTQTVEITCPTEGAKIYYTVDGSEPDENSTLYEVPFELQLSPNMTVKALAVNGDLRSEIAEKRYYFSSVNNIPDFVTNGNPEGTLINQSLMVLGGGETRRFVIDGDGNTIRISGSDASGLASGKWITGVVGKYTDLNGVPVLVLTETPKPATAEIQPIGPETVTATQLADKMGHYVVVDDLQLSGDDSGDKLNVVAFDADNNKINIVDESKVLSELESWQKFSATGIVTDSDGSPVLVLLGMKLADMPPVKVSARSSNPDFGTATIGDIGESEIEVDPGTKVQLHAVPNEGFKFIGWFSNGEVAVSQDADYLPLILTNEVYTAKFDYIIAQPRSVTIESSPEDGGNVWFVNPMPEEGAKTIDTRAYVTVEAEEGDNSRAFAGWYIGDEKVSSESSYTYMGESAVTLTARFTVSYVVQVEQPEHGDLKIADVDGNVIEMQNGKVRLPYGTRIRFVTTPDEGYTIKAVYINRVGDYGELANKGQNVTYDVIKDIVVSAEFELISRSVTVKCDETQGTVTLSSGYNSETGQPSGTIYQPLTAMLYGTQFYVTVHPAVDRYLKNITVDGVSRTADYKRDGYLLLTLGADFVNIEVEFSIFDEKTEYTVTVKSGDEQMGSAYLGEPDVASVVVESGSQVTATAVPVRDTRFSHWLAQSIKVSEEPEYTFTPEKNVTLTAVFEYLIPKQRKVSVATSHADRGTVAILSPDDEGRGVVNTQRYVDVSATPNEDCRFTGWTDEDGIKVSDEPEFTYMGAEPMMLTANFTCDFVVKAAPCEGGSITLTDTDGNPIESGTELPEGTEVNVALEATGYNKIVSVAINGDPMEIQPSQTNLSFTFTLDSDKEVSAMFSPDKGLGVYVEADLPEGGSAWINAEGTTELMVDGGTGVRLYAEAEYGYKFNGWEVDGTRVSTDNPYNVVITRTTSFTALFDYQIDVERTIRIGVSDPTKGAVRFTDPATTAIELNTRKYVEVEAEPSGDDHTFVSWTDAKGNIVSLLPKFVYESGKDVSLTANFVSRYKVTYASGENGELLVADRDNNDIASGTRVAEGAVIAITLVPDTGYKVINLSINGEDVTDDYNASRRYTYVVNGPTDIKAEFIDLASAISITGADAASEVWYDLSGQRVDPSTAPRPAVYIVVSGTDTRKVLLK